MLVYKLLKRFQCGFNKNTMFIVDSTYTFEENSHNILEVKVEKYAENNKLGTFVTS